MSPALLLALGALAVAYLGALGLLVLPVAALRPRRWPLALGALAAFLSLALRPDPGAGRIGERVTPSGFLRQGVLASDRGPVYVDDYPLLRDGHYRLLGRLRRPRPRRNPGGFDEAGWLRGRGIRVVLASPRVLVYAPPSGPQAWVRRQLERGQSPAVASLARALVLGDRQALGALRRSFQRAGLAHLMALSGLHLGLVAGAVFWLFGPLGRLRYLAAILAATGYLALAGPSPSLVRAFLMLLAWTGLGLLGRGRPDPRRALALAFAVQLILWPHSVYALGFWLSYLAVAGLLFGLPLLPKTLRPRPLWLGLLTPVLATLPMTPLLLDQFHRLPLLGPLANLGAVPLAGVFLGLAFLKGLGLSFLAAPLEVAGRGLLGLAHLFQGGPALTWGSIGPGGYLLFYAGLAALVLVVKGALRPTRGLALVALAIGVSLGAARLPLLHVWQLDVGEGHATLVQLDPGPALLVDAGPRWAGARVVRALRALGLAKLDLLVLTHADQDHAGGAAAVIRALPVGALLVGPGHPEDAALRAARLAGVPIQRAGYGDHGRLGPLDLFVWNPPRPPPKEDNAQSLVLEVGWRGRRVVVLGDLPQAYEDLLPQRRADVLVASHHGAKNGTGPQALAALRPRVVLIGVGRNRFGHPAPQTLARIRAAGAEVFRTDLSGAIEVRLLPF